MAILVHRYDAPDRFVAGTVGQPGERTFFLQAREGNRITTVVVEKQQVSVLAEHLDRVLDEVLRRSGPAAEVPPAHDRPSDTEPLDAPITEEFRVGTMTIAWDPRSTGSSSSCSPTSTARTRSRGRGSRAVRRTGEPRPRAATEIDADEVFVVKITASYARDFVARRPGPGRGRPAALPVLPAAARSRRAHLPAGQRLPPAAVRS